MMKYVLRKEDSSANILLFIYGYSKRFRQEAEKGLRLSSILSTMKLFGKNESAVRMALSRVVKSGLFENCKKGNETYYVPTAAGNIFISIYENGVNSFIKRLQMRYMHWDGKWSIMSIFYNQDTTSDDKKEIIKCLQRYGFTKVSGDIWISPYDMTDESGKLEQLLGDKGVHYLMHAEFDAKEEVGNFLDRIYKTGSLRKSYLDFVENYEDRLADLENTVKMGNTIENRIAIPLYYELGLNFFNFSLNDPLLPQELLPEWDGEKAVSLMMRLMELLLPCVRNYFEFSC